MFRVETKIKAVKVNPLTSKMEGLVDLVSSLVALQATKKLGLHLALKTEWGKGGKDEAEEEGWVNHWDEAPHSRVELSEWAEGAEMRPQVQKTIVIQEAAYTKD